MSLSLSFVVYMLPTMYKDFQFSIERIYQGGNFISLFTSIFCIGRFNMRVIINDCLVFIDLFYLEEKFRNKKSELIYIILIIYFLSTSFVLMFSLPDLQTFFLITLGFYSSKVMPYRMIVLFRTPIPYYLIPYLKGFTTMFFVSSPLHEFLNLFIEWMTATVLFFIVKVFPKFTGQEILPTPMFLRCLCGECDI